MSYRDRPPTYPTDDGSRIGTHRRASRGVSVRGEYNQYDEPMGSDPRNRRMGLTPQEEWDAKFAQAPGWAPPGAGSNVQSPASAAASEPDPYSFAPASRQVHTAPAVPVAPVAMSPGAAGPRARFPDMNSVMESRVPGWGGMDPTARLAALQAMPKSGAMVGQVTGRSGYTSTSPAQGAQIAARYGGSGSVRWAPKQVVNPANPLVVTQRTAAEGVTRQPSGPGGQPGNAPNRRALLGVNTGTPSWNPPVPATSSSPAPKIALPARPQGGALLSEGIGAAVRGTPQFFDDAGGMFSGIANDAKQAWLNVSGSGRQLPPQAERWKSDPRALSTRAAFARENAVNKLNRQGQLAAQRQPGYDPVAYLKKLREQRNPGARHTEIVKAY